MEWRFFLVRPEDQKQSVRAIDSDIRTGGCLIEARHAQRSFGDGFIAADTMRRRFTHAMCRKAHSSKQRYRLSDIAGRSLVWLPRDFDPGLLPIAWILSARAFGLPAS